MLRITSITALLALSAAPALADHHAGTTGYVLADDGATLIVMPNLAATGEAMQMSLATPLRAIAWRPVTSELLGYADGAIFTVDPATGEMTDLGAAFAADASIGAGQTVALDFNNAIDAVRAVSTAGDNLVYFPVGFGDTDERAGSVRRFTELAYAEGDVMAGTSPMIFANAYTNAINGETAESTFQYALDAETDALVSLANNAGTLETIGKVTVDGAMVDLAASGGFDIVSPAEGDDQAYAVLRMEGEPMSALYTIDLSTGEAVQIAEIGANGIVAFAASRP